MIIIVIFLVAMFVLSYFVQVDFYFWFIVLLSALGMMSVKTYGKKTNGSGELKAENDELRTESSKLKTENGELREESSKLKAENGELREEGGELRSKNGDLKTENDVLRSENGDLKRENEEFKTETYRKPDKAHILDIMRNCDIFLEEINEISEQRSSGRVHTDIMNNIINGILMKEENVASIMKEIEDIEATYYPEAFSRYFKPLDISEKYDKHHKLRDLYQSNNYDSNVYRNDAWARRRIHELDAQIKIFESEEQK